MLWTLAIFPVLSAVVLLAAGARQRSTLAFAASLGLAITLLPAALAVQGGWESTLTWNTPLQLQARLTPLASVMALLVPIVAWPVLLYCAVHEQCAGLPRLIALLLVFVGAMELVVIAADLLTLLIGWEAVGACSWALIGHHWRDRANPCSGLYAFITTRFGDLGLFLAAMAAFAGTGSFEYANLPSLHGIGLHLFVFGILLSAAAKSAQIPFAPWLFRAMAGPTSVSALLHAATMVAAGAYLLARLQPALDRVAWFATATIAVGLATALAGGLVALLQSHSKKLLAASTSAQFGLMFIAVGAGYPAIAILHLAAHAFFKALLFLAAGVASQRAGGFRLARMGYGRALPVVATLSAVGSLALAGLPPLGAGWTKGAITTAAGQASVGAALAVIGAGGLSAAYATRFQLLAYGFFGGEKGTAPNRPHQLETLGLAVLAAASLLFALLWLPAVQDTVAKRLAIELPTAKPWELTTSLIALGIGLYVGRLLARRHPTLGNAPHVAPIADWLGLPAVIHSTVTRPISSLAQGMACVDDRVIDAVPSGLAAITRSFLAQRAARMDDRIVDAMPRGVAALGSRLAVIGARFGELLADGLPEGSARLIGLGAEDARALQTGLSHHYYALIAIGAAVLAVILLAGS